MPRYIIQNYKDAGTYICIVRKKLKLIKIHLIMIIDSFSELKKKKRQDTNISFSLFKYFYVI